MHVVPEQNPSCVGARRHRAVVRELPLLDESVVFFGSELADPPSHAKNNMPILLAGGTSGTVRTGRWIKCGALPHNKLLTSVLSLFGDTRISFGDSRVELERAQDAESHLTSYARDGRRRPTVAAITARARASTRARTPRGKGVTMRTCSSSARISAARGATGRSLSARCAAALEYSSRVLE